MRSSSSKIPHLVVGPDGIELFIAHKERVKAAMQPIKTSTGPNKMVGMNIVSIWQGTSLCTACHRSLSQLYQTQQANL